MVFKSAAALESVVWQLRLDDYPRASNRALINDLANGWPPYSQDEVVQNNINFNFNDLSATKILHDARRQFYNGMITPDPYWYITCDYGPVYRRNEWGSKITKNLSKYVKKNRRYRQTLQDTFKGDVLHGIGPTIWKDRYCWRPRCVGIEDVLVPSGTLLDLENLPFFFVYHQWTAQELHKMTSGPRVDPKWNLPLVKQAIAWCDEQARTLLGQSWPEVWMPDKMSERIKEDTGLFANSKVPTVNVYDCYWYEDTNKYAGWNRAVILDAWGTPSVGFGGYDYGGGKQLPNKPSRKKMADGTELPSEFLYAPSTGRKYAEKMEQVIHFQFADGSAVSPSRYHSIRSLGFLLYNVCQIQNRLRCKFTEAAFECMMQYLRSSNPDDAERALKVNLIDKRVLPTGIDFVKKEERWQFDLATVETALQMGRQTMADNSASFTQDFDFTGEQEREETATRTMAKVNASAALVASMLNQAYDSQEDQAREIVRRFCIPGSKDPDVKAFRLACLHDNIPEEVLCPEYLQVSMNRVIGSGNKMLQNAMMDKMMALYYDKLPPESQQKVLRMGVAITTDDYDLASNLVPETQHVSDSVVAAQNAFGTLMTGSPVSFRSGWNVVEFIETMLHSMSTKVVQIEQAGGMTDAQTLEGLQNASNFIGSLIQMLSQDPNEKQRVKVYSDDLGKLNNMVKAYAQRLAESQQQMGNGEANGIDAKTQATVNAINLQAQTKAKNSEQAHAQKTAQKQIAFEQKLEQSSQQHRANLAEQAHQTRADIASTDVTTAAQIRRDNISAENDRRNQTTDETGVP